MTVLNYEDGIAPGWASQPAPLPSRPRDDGRPYITPAARREARRRRFPDHELARAAHHGRVTLQELSAFSVAVFPPGVATQDTHDLTMRAVLRVRPDDMSALRGRILHAVVGAWRQTGLGQGGLDYRHYGIDDMRAAHITAPDGYTAEALHWLSEQHDGQAPPAVAGLAVHDMTTSLVVQGEVPRGPASCAVVLGGWRLVTVPIDLRYSVHFAVMRECIVTAIFDGRVFDPVSAHGLLHELERRFVGSWPAPVTRHVGSGE